MAAHDSKNLFTPGLTPSELAEHVEAFSTEASISSEQLNQYTTARSQSLNWLREMAGTYHRRWMQWQQSHSELQEVNESNFDEKRKALRDIPEMAWNDFQIGEEFSKRRADLGSKPLPIIDNFPVKKHGSDNGQGFDHAGTVIYLDHDPRYEEILSKKVAIWNNNHPEGRFKGEILLTREDGSRYTSKEALLLIPDLEVNAKNEFREKYEESFSYYESNEKERIYRDKDQKVIPENDPSYQKLQKEIQEQTDNELTSQTNKLKHDLNAELSIQNPDRRKIEAQKRDELLMEYAEKYPEKAEAYGQIDSILQKAYLKMQEEIRVKEGKKNIFKKTQSTSEASQSAVFTLSMTPGITQNFQTGAEGADNTPLIPPTGNVNVRRQPSMTPSTGRRTPSSGGGGSRRSAPPPNPPPGSGINTAIKVGRVLWPIIVPIGWAFFLLVIIVVFYSIFGGRNNEVDQPTETPVTITKSGPSTVANGENITYELFVSYPEFASDIVVTDLIPSGTSFVEASGVYHCEPDDDCGEETTSVIWKASEQNGVTPTSALYITTPSPNPQPKTTTIHNLGFGPSDGSRIDNLVRTLSPGSPVIGQGDYIIQLAKEFNIDPLMIIVFKNESQFCNDTGVVSPDGSDPDNYNCGGILWPAAQQETSTSRWSARAGPVAYTHVFTFVPKVQDGLGLFFDYISASFYQGKTIQDFYDIYNPCADSDQYGLLCGAEGANRMLELLRESAGPPCTSGSGCYVGEGGGVSFPTLNFTIKLKPTDNTYVVNQASAEVLH